jgi:hypothetical protein
MEELTKKITFAARSPVGLPGRKKSLAVRPDSLSYASGEVAERLNVAVSKTVVRETVPGVRIPPSPQNEMSAPRKGGIFRLVAG